MLPPDSPREDASTNDALVDTGDQGEREAPEGQILYLVHRRHGRDGALVAARKRAVLKRRVRNGGLGGPGEGLLAPAPSRSVTHTFKRNSTKTRSRKGVT